jgi:hypothetical protein
LGFFVNAVCDCVGGGFNAGSVGSTTPFVGGVPGGFLLKMVVAIGGGGGDSLIWCARFINCQAR